VSDPRDAAAALLEGACEELTQAAAHLRVAAEHFRNREIPRACAHQWAARGHLLKALDAMDEQAREHAARSIPVGN
jgi:F0F1-type ATP synthase membrane subunit b/b'